MATGYGPRSSRELCTCAAQCLGFQFAPMAARCRSCSSKDIAHVRGVWLVGDWKRLAYFAVRGRAGQVASMAAGLWPALIKRIAHVRGLVPGFSIRGAWPHGTSRAHGGGLMARAHQEGCARSRGVVGRGLEGLSHWGVWPGAVHLDWSKSPRWMGARRCAGGSLPGWAGRKQVWAELFPR